MNVACRLFSEYNTAYCEPFKLPRRLAATPLQKFEGELFSHVVRGGQCRQAMRTRRCGGIPADLIFCFFLIKQKENKKNHLGSYCALTNASKQVVQSNRFDPWGNPITLSTLTGFPKIKRGFTGHEHYPEFKP